MIGFLFLTGSTFSWICTWLWMVSRRWNLEVRPLVSDIIVEEQQLTSTPDAAIGTTRRGMLPQDFMPDCAFLLLSPSSQAFANPNSGGTARSSSCQRRYLSKEV